MKTKMEDIDKLIKETLTQEEAKFYDGLEEQNVLNMFTGLFKGKNVWIIILMNIVKLVFFVFFVYCLVKFFKTDNTNELLQWGFGGISMLIGISILKVFAWMQMDKNAILREMKRLELQISSLSGRMSK
ncbi:hypothetical protein L3X39_09660 [Sabulilitoribacter multivorans]|uniref:Holin-X, holin superfamily III n=1 Tax=Flaviramulus multivorans TaxID=1304750 RepID=A0ABS9IJZ1_9FLAO|nr:DUF6768 family protein [Flaviramulus multivorans]MCF7560900.1 hypothetical protein [Flaviramulus multivorans]